MDSNNVDHGLENAKSDLKSSTPYFASNENMLECQGNLRIELYLFEGVLVLVITCLGRQFEINCLSAFLKILKLPYQIFGNVNFFVTRGF